MTCCCPHSRSGGRLFSFFARSYRRRFSKKGFEPSQKQLLAGLAAAGYQGADLLEIGSGVGHLHLYLLEQGAKRATGIDLAVDMIAEARNWAEQRGLAERVTYINGDFIEHLNEIETTDICLLDKVVCCYPDADTLVNQSIRKTGRVYALTYPRYRWFIRMAVGLGAVILKLFGSDFRPYAHNPADIERWINAAGFSKFQEYKTFIWLTQIYVHSAEH
ncbi:MAG: class I SAM-dependent methyltransferase [Gammaproteobacteria bacterium]|nr:class I SAM-dependent methyltransferase [Gammaproteobacteria bacterium]MDH5653733.1 class I SAM-dependent methyltransferase [Gammaproteobacteria bacterium]